MPHGTSLIAVVDDEESVRKALGRLIGSAGFNVDTFSSGGDFLRSLEQRRPQCVVLDLHMPHMSGFDVQEALTRIGAPVPVVIITASDSSEARARAVNQGARVCLRKPVDEAMLLDAIQTAIHESPPVVR